MLIIIIITITKIEKSYQQRRDKTEKTNTHNAMFSETVGLNILGCDFHGPLSLSGARTAQWASVWALTDDVIKTLGCLYNTCELGFLIFKMGIIIPIYTHREVIEG